MSSRKKGFLDFLGAFIDEHPLIRHFVRQTQFYIWKLRIELRAFNKCFDVNKTHWIDPERIEYCTLEEFDLSEKGKVIGGDWDRLKKKVEDQDVYKAIKDVFIDGKNWESTAFYNNILYEILNVRKRWGCRTKAEWDARLKQIELLYQDIKNHGYKSSKEIFHASDPMKAEDEVSVNIGRNGDLLLNHGRHRLSIAKLLMVPKIPITFMVRHARWVRFKVELLAFIKDTGGELYHPVTHPDLLDLPVHYDEYRFNVIKENLSTKKGKLLDIGAYLGYFCHRFEDEGFNCYAVESNQKCAYLMRKLRRAENKKFKIIATSIFEYNNEENLDFDVVLALNIFHHFLKNKDTYEKLVALLKRLKMKELFFQAPNPEEPQMESAYKNYQPNEFVGFILKYSCLNESKLIGVTSDKRCIYRLFKHSI